MELIGQPAKTTLICFVAAPSFADSWLTEDIATIRYAPKGGYPASFIVKE